MFKFSDYLYAYLFFIDKSNTRWQTPNGFHSVKSSRVILSWFANNFAWIKTCCFSHSSLTKREKKIKVTNTWPNINGYTPYMDILSDKVRSEGTSVVVVCVQCARFLWKTTNRYDSTTRLYWDESFIAIEHWVEVKKKTSLL